MSTMWPILWAYDMSAVSTCYAQRVTYAVDTWYVLRVIYAVGTWYVHRATYVELT